MSERFFNKLYFALRSRLRWSRPTYRPRNEDKSQFFDIKPHLLPAAARLEHHYHLKGFRCQSTSSEYREALYVLELLERFFPLERLRDPVRALDVGSKNFAYARGLYHFYRHAGAAHPRAVLLTGIEADAYQIYVDLHSRYDYALYHIRDLDGCRFLPGDVTGLHERYDAITWFLPFVSEGPHRKWGLPGSLFKPEAMLRHVFRMLASGGAMLIANREEEERDIQAKLLERLRIPFHPPERYEADWMAYAPRYVTLVERP